MQKGITILLINLDNSTTFQAKVAFNSSWSLRHQRRAHRSRYKHKTWGLRHKHRWKRRIPSNSKRWEFTQPNDAAKWKCFNCKFIWGHTSFGAFVCKILEPNKGSSLLYCICSHPKSCSPCLHVGGH
jgi:hypothetical protein